MKSLKERLDIAEERCVRLQAQIAKVRGSLGGTSRAMERYKRERNSHAVAMASAMGELSRGDMVVAGEILEAALGEGS